LFLKRHRIPDRAASATHSRAGATLAEVTPVLIWA